MKLFTTHSARARICHDCLQTVDLVSCCAVRIQIHWQTVSKRVLGILDFSFDEVNDAIFARVSAHFQAGNSQINSYLTPWEFGSRQYVYSADIQYIITRVTLVSGIGCVFERLNNTQTAILQTDLTRFCKFAVERVMFCPIVYVLSSLSEAPAYSYAEQTIS